jgi:hypothetical protein
MIDGEDGVRHPHVPFILGEVAGDIFKNTVDSVGFGVHALVVR